MKKFLPMVVLALLVSCGGSEKRVAVAPYNMRDPFIGILTRQVESNIGECIAVKTVDSRNSQLLQNEYIEKMVHEESDLLIINPVDRLGANAVIRKLKRSRIPVIFYNREPLREDLDLWDQAFYVGARAEQSGQLQAELVMNLFGGNPEKLNRFDRNGDNRIQAVILKGEQGHQDAEIRTDEVVRSFKDRGFELDILITEAANWNRAEAFSRMENILRNYGPSVEVILSNNDAMAIGAIGRMRQDGWFRDTNGNGKIDSGDEKWIPVVGIDGLTEAVDYIKRGYLYGTVLNDSKEQARAIGELTKVILGLSDNTEFTIVDGSYIWIDYKVFHLE